MYYYIYIIFYILYRKIANSDQKKMAACRFSPQLGGQFCSVFYPRWKAKVLPCLQYLCSSSDSGYFWGIFGVSITRGLRHSPATIHWGAAGFAFYRVCGGLQSHDGDDLLEQGVLKTNCRAVKWSKREPLLLFLGLVSKVRKWFAASFR